MADRYPIKIFIGSIGRRVYLVRWFEQAFSLLGIDGEVHVSDADEFSAGMSRSTFSHVVPRYEDALYETEMTRLFAEIQPDLFFSVNDYELNRLAHDGLALKFEQIGGAVLSLSQTKHRLVHDKYAMSLELSKLDIPTPQTVLLSEIDEVCKLAAIRPQLIIKDRFGSGSSGLKKVSSEDLLAEIRGFGPFGNPSMRKLDRYIVQPAIRGQEFGLDLVAPIIPDAHDTAVLARSKLRMRAGETDHAESVDSSVFLETGRQVSAWLNHRGLIDVDVIVDDLGTPFVIDINPRFGGGYPFNHLSGANVPALYVAQLVGHQKDTLQRYLRYETGVRASKFEEVTLGKADSRRLNTLRENRNARR